MWDRSSERRTPRPAGEAFAAGSSRRIAAHASVTADGAAVELRDTDEGTVLASAPPSAIRRERRLGSLPSTILFPGGWRFLSRDHEAMDALLGTEEADRLHRWEAWRPEAGRGGGARLRRRASRSGAGGSARWSPSRWRSPPMRSPRAVDDGHLAFADRTLADPSGLRQAETKGPRASRCSGGWKAVAPTPRFGDYKLAFRSMPKMGPNAFALPGGTIVFTDELVRAFPEPDVIAGVLGHEIAHVAEAHGLRQVYRSLGTYLLVAAIVGDVGPVLDDMLLEGGLLLSLSLSREHEREADRIGLTLAARAGYDPAALARFFERFSADDTGGGPSWLSTHPDTGERILEIRRLAEEIARSGE